MALMGTALPYKQQPSGSRDVRKKIRIWGRSELGNGHSLSQSHSHIVIIIINGVHSWIGTKGAERPSNHLKGTKSS